MKSRLKNLQKCSKTCKYARKPKNRRIWKKLIEDVLDDSGSLLYMGSVLSESCKELGKVHLLRRGGGGMKMS